MVQRAGPGGRGDAPPISIAVKFSPSAWPVRFGREKSRQPPASSDCRDCQPHAKVCNDMQYHATTLHRGYDAWSPFLTYYSDYIFYSIKALS